MACRVKSSSSRARLVSLQGHHDPGLARSELTISSSTASTLRLLVFAVLQVTSSWRDENWAADLQQRTCKYCGILFNTAQSLREHVKGVHLKLNSYSCEYCHQTFKWRMALSRHRRNFHKLFVKNNVKFENQQAVGLSSTGFSLKSACKRLICLS